MPTTDRPRSRFCLSHWGWFLLATVILVISFVGLSNWGHHREQQVIQKIEESWGGIVTYPYNVVITKLNFPYEMGEAEKQHFLDKFKTLRQGEPYKEVVELLGPPYRQQRISAMEHARPLGIRLIYYVKKLDNGVNVKFDQFVSLEFDNDLKLASVGLQNLSELSQQLTDLPVTATNWNKLTKNIDILVRPENKRGRSGVPSDDKNSRK